MEMRILHSEGKTDHAYFEHDAPVASNIFIRHNNSNLREKGLALI